jgi:hypothetical protein
LNPLSLHESDEEDLDQDSRTECDLKILNFFRPLKKLNILHLYIVQIGSNSENSNDSKGVNDNSKDMLFGLLLEDLIPEQITEFSLYINKKETKVYLKLFSQLELKNSELPSVREFTCNVLKILSKER